MGPSGGLFFKMVAIMRLSYILSIEESFPANLGSTSPTNAIPLQIDPKQPSWGPFFQNGGGIIKLKGNFVNRCSKCGFRIIRGLWN